MHVTACLAGQDEVEVGVGEECRTLQALKETIVVALPKLCVEGFDVSVGGRGLDDDEGVVSLSEDVCLDVVPNTRVLSVLALREAGREVSEDGLLRASEAGDVSQCTLYLDAGVPIDCVDGSGRTSLHRSCLRGHFEIARLLLDRGSTAIDEKHGVGLTPFHLSCCCGRLAGRCITLGGPSGPPKNRTLLRAFGDRETPARPRLRCSLREGEELRILPSRSFGASVGDGVKAFEAENHLNTTLDLELLSDRVRKQQDCVASLKCFLHSASLFLSGYCELSCVSCPGQ